MDEQLWLILLKSLSRSALHFFNGGVAEVIRRLEQRVEQQAPGKGREKSRGRHNSNAPGQSMVDGGLAAAQVRNETITSGVQE